MPVERPRTASAERWLASASWAVPLAGVATIFATSSMASQAVSSSLLMGFLSVFFVVLLARLTLSVILQPGRRVSLVALAAGVALWAAGAAVLNAAGAETVTRFPAPGEWLFLTAYLGIAVHLVIGGSSTSRVSFNSWLEAGTVCGGAACLAGVLITGPLSSDFGRQGVPLLAALLYPILDVTLAVLVAGQLVLHKRSLSGASLALVGGLAALGVADTSIVASLSRGT